MKIPFTIDQFLDVFRTYNLAVWPMQIVLHLLALAAIILAVKKNRTSDRLISSILVFLWLWMGVVYHLLFFTPINKGAYLFGILFLLQAFLFLYEGVLKTNLSFKYRSDIYAKMGGFFMFYALVLYPAIGYLSGHVYPKAPLFGLPCPTTVFTFGILLWTKQKINIFLLLIPFLWSMVGFSAAVSLQVTEDFGLFGAGVITILLIAVRDRKSVII